MAATWKTIRADEVQPGARVRHPSGAEFEVARIDRPFLGMDAMLCFIEDTPERWHAYPAGCDNNVEILSSSATS
jgi:hypothetical protein